MKHGGDTDLVDERCAHIIARRLQLQKFEVLVTHIHPAHREPALICLDGDSILFPDFGDGHREIIQNPACMSRWSATFACIDVVTCHNACAQVPQGSYMLTL